VRSSQLLEAGSKSAENFCNFSIKITHFYAYFGQNSYFKAIIDQLKAFKISLNVLNRINEVHYSICINVTKYDITFSTKGGF